jgi:hypothetical protein
MVIVGVADDDGVDRIGDSEDLMLSVVAVLPALVFSIVEAGQVIAGAENLGSGTIVKRRFLVPDRRSAGRVFEAKRRKPARHRETPSSHLEPKSRSPCWVETR